MAEVTKIDVMWEWRTERARRTNPNDLHAVRKELVLFGFFPTTFSYHVDALRQTLLKEWNFVQNTSHALSQQVFKNKATN